MYVSTSIEMFGLFYLHELMRKLPFGRPMQVSAHDQLAATWESVWPGLYRVFFNCLHPFQSESLVALEAAKAAEKSVLDEQVRSSQETLQEKLKELSVLQQQNVKVKKWTD